MNRRISQAEPIRSTWTFRRVTQTWPDPDTSGRVPRLEAASDMDSAASRASTSSRPFAPKKSIAVIRAASARNRASWDGAGSFSSVRMSLASAR